MNIATKRSRQEERFSPRRQLSPATQSAGGPIPSVEDDLQGGRSKFENESGKIRRISRTVRRIDSGFRGRCYEMDPCTARRAWEQARRRNESKRKRGPGCRERSWVSPSYPPPPPPPPLPLRDERTLPTTTHSLSLSPRPLLLLQIYKLSHSRDRTHGRIEPPHGKFDGIGRLIPLQRDVDFHSLRRWGSRQLLLLRLLPLRLRLRLLSLVGYPRLFASSFGRSHFVLCSTYVSRVRNNAKDRGGMRRGSSVGEALLLIVLTGGIFELERARREREMDGLSVCGWGRESVRVEMEMKRCCCFLLDCDSLPRLLFDVILL